jgi:pimeloyl-ACP methyl ester carboxylesterase
MRRTTHWFYVSAILLSVFLSACDQRTDLATIEQKYANAASRSIELQGMRVHYRDEGAGQVLVLLHGTGSSLHTWDAWVEQLAGRYRVIRMDLPGSGLTGPRPDRAYEVAADITFLADFLDGLEIRQAHLVGSSLGGRIAWEYALRNPEGVASLTLISALGYPQERWPPAIELAQLPVIDRIMATHIPRFVFKTSLKDIYHENFRIDDALVDRYYELALREGNLQAFTDRVKARLDQDSHLIPQIRTPSLILWGESDRYFPVSSAWRFHEDIPGSRLVVFPNVGHLPMEEIPQASAAALIEFL